ncbi:MAG: ABC transporter permease [Opitutaceae bacterium]|jgi:putative ABC transport system permease protein
MKRLLATQRLAFRALRRNAMRSLLTMLGIVIGVAAVIAMVSIGTGARTQVERQIASLGQNLILVMSGNAKPGGVFTGFGGAGTLTVADADAIRAEIDGVAVVSPEVRGSAQLVAGNLNWSTTVMGESHDYLNLRQWPASDGAFFTELDVRKTARVAVLGRTVATTLFPAASAVGQSVRIQGVPFSVVGVLAAKGTNTMGQDQDDVVFVPYTTAMRRLFGQTNLRSMNVSATAPTVIADVSEQISELLRQRHRIQAGHDDDFMVRTQQEIAQFATSTSRVMTALLGAIAGVSLLVGGIGIMNIMLVSVTERTREIGIRMAIGARRRDILRQFLIESVLLTSAGGLVGIASGIAASRALAAELDWATLTPAYAVASAFLFSAAVGVFFGYYPARKAARLDPIEALRYE